MYKFTYLLTCAEFIAWIAVFYVVC